MAVSIEVNGVAVVSHVGLVLGLREINKYDDSDFLARVWNPELAKVEEVHFASTRYWSYNNHAEIDAGPEVVALAAAYVEAERVAYQAKLAAAKAAVPVVGSDVVVSLKAGKNKSLSGEIGRVFWIGADKFAPVQRVGNIMFAAPLKYGVELASTGQKLFLGAKNVILAGTDTNADSAALALSAL